PGWPEDRRATPSGQVQDDWRVVRGALALALLPVDERVRHPRRQRWRAEREVDPHAAPLLEAQLRVVPVGVDTRAGGVLARQVADPGVQDRLEGRPFRR